MNSFFAFCTTILLILNIQISNAQTLSKDEKKGIKTQLKEYKKDPAKYKSMIDGYNKKIKSSDTQLEEMKLEVTRVKLRAKQDLQEANDTIAALQSRLTAAISAQSVSGAKLPSGNSYGVQIGKYKFMDVTKYFGTDKYLNSFKLEDGNEYVVTFFLDPQAAEALANDIHKMGIKDAFVTKYIDGKRVPYDIRKEKN